MRGVTPQALEAFDPVSQTLVSGTRDSTTVPTQALFLLNSTFVRQQSLAFAERQLAGGERPDAERIRQIYLSVLGRPATEAEVARSAQFLTDYASSWRDEGIASQLAAASPEQAESETGGATAVAGQAKNPDDVSRTPEMPREAPVKPKSAQASAWMNFIQALYASAEFRFVR